MDGWTDEWIVASLVAICDLILICRNMRNINHGMFGSKDDANLLARWPRSPPLSRNDSRRGHLECSDHIFLLPKGFFANRMNGRWMSWYWTAGKPHVSQLLWKSKIPGYEPRLAGKGSLNSPPWLHSDDPHWGSVIFLILAFRSHHWKTKVSGRCSPTTLCSRTLFHGHNAGE